MSPDRSRRPRLGLRARLTAALVLTSAVTLAAVAFALLGPLQSRLTADRINTLEATTRAARPAFAELPDSAARPHSRLLHSAALAMRRRTGGEVAVFDTNGRLLATTDADSPPPVAAAKAALVGAHPIRQVAGPAGNREAVVAVRAGIGERTVVGVTVRKSLADVDASVAGVRQGFILAALFGLTVATLIGIAMATGLVRRLRDLRSATLKVAELGPDVELAMDHRRDEVGDLTRAFVTLQGRLREQEQARQTFVATASHELRTPLATLSLALDMLEEDLAAGRVDMEAAGRQVADARGQSDRLSKLAAQLLDLSRIDAGVPLSSELVDLPELCRAVLAEFGPRAPDGVEMSSSGACWAVADPSSVARVVRILVDNALRFTPAGERVQVSVACDSGQATVAVSDRGPGVPEDERDAIFERFRRGADASDDGGGFGLGLAIGRELALRMDGNLRLDSSADCTCFVLTLPSAPAVEQGASSESLSS
jgi:signal transduction histidine kinase